MTKVIIVLSLALLSNVSQAEWMSDGLVNAYRCTYQGCMYPDNGESAHKECDRRDSYQPAAYNMDWVYKGGKEPKGMTCVCSCLDLRSAESMRGI